VSSSLTAHQHNYAIQCHSHQHTVENYVTEDKSKTDTLHKLNRTQKKQTTQITAEQN